MQYGVYWIFVGGLVVTIVAAIAVGGAMWIAPVVAIAAIGAYAVADRRMRSRQSRAERLSSQVDPDR